MGELLGRVGRAVFWESIEIFVALMCMFVGLPMLAAPRMFAPIPMQGIQVQWLLTAWAALIVVGSAVNLQGILTWNLYTRRAGLILMAGAATALAWAQVWYWHPSRLFALVTYILAAAAFIARYTALGRLSRALSLVARLEAVRDKR